MQRAYQHGSDSDYTPIAVYYDEADSLEYVRRDEPSIYRRIDGLLTLILSMSTREPVGFQLKGFRHFYVTHIISRKSTEDGDTFLKLVTILEKAVEILGNEIFSGDEIRSAYMKAQDIAKEDHVQISALPFVA